MILPSQHLFVFYSFVAAGISFWLIIEFILSLVGGWHSLSKLYRSNTKSSGKRFSAATMLLGSGSMPLSYRSCMIIRVDQTAISLSVFPLFRCFHPRLLIPWSAISSCRQESFWFLNAPVLILSNRRSRCGFLEELAKRFMSVGKKRYSQIADKPYRNNKRDNQI
jgi:hypothetical protein